MPPKRKPTDEFIESLSEDLEERVEESIPEPRKLSRATTLGSW